MQNPIPRVQVRPLIQVLLIALVLPVGLAFLADWALGTAPLVAVVVSIICIPLATILVIQRTLHDMNALIAVVAPPEVETTDEENPAESTAEADCHDGAAPEVQKTEAQKTEAQQPNKTS